MNYQNGTILTGRIDTMPLLYHKGIIVNGAVCHNTPSKKNEAGGNIVCEPVDTYIQNRTIVSVKQTNADDAQILKTIENDKQKPFNVLTNNCEHFVSKAISGKSKSVQVVFVAGITILILLLFILKK